MITNLTRDKVSPEFVVDTCAVVAKVLGKPVERCIVSVTTDVLMSFGGTSGPCAQAIMMSIGAIGIEENKKTSAVLAQHVEKELGISKDRMYIHFQDYDKANVGHNGTTKMFV